MNQKCNLIVSQISQCPDRGNRFNCRKTCRNGSSRSPTQTADHKNIYAIHHPAKTPRGTRKALICSVRTFLQDVTGTNRRAAILCQPRSQTIINKAAVGAQLCRLFIKEKIPHHRSLHTYSESKWKTYRQA